jgi:hypothetical protein
MFFSVSYRMTVKLQQKRINMETYILCTLSVISWRCYKRMTKTVIHLSLVFAPSMCKLIRRLLPSSEVMPLCLICVYFFRVPSLMLVVPVPLFFSKLLLPCTTFQKTFAFLTRISSYLSPPQGLTQYWIQ